MNSTSCWVDHVLEADGRKYLVYNLKVNGGAAPKAAPDGVTGEVERVFRDYCSTSEHYIKLNSDQCKLLGLSYPVFLSFSFVQAAIRADGISYPWNQVRGPQHADIPIPLPGIMDPEEYPKAYDLHWQDFLDCFNSRHRNVRDAVKGGYIVPGRDLNGHPYLYILGDSFKAFYLSSAWERVLKASTTLIEGWGDGAVFRSINPSDLELVIQPHNLDHGQIGGGYKLVNGVTWDFVKDTFEQLLKADDTIKTRYLFSFPGDDHQNYMRLSVNPFYHYETWISKQQYVEFFRIDRPVPFPDQAHPQLVTRLQKLRGEMELSIEDEIAAQKLVYGQAKVTWDMHSGIINLSADRIIKGAGKRKGARSQKSVMGQQSAPAIAKEVFGWDGNDRPTPFHIAEWLHISAFSFGGLAEGADSWHTSQMQLNMIFGSSETNSFMLRYEKAWQELFKLEHALRSARGKDPRVEGQLTFTNNRDMEVQCNLINQQTGERGIHEVPFNGYPGWVKYFDISPWLCFVLGYLVRINDRSLLLDWEKPEFEINFYPFARPFFTKGETLLDTLLLKCLFDQKMKETKAQINQQSLSLPLFHSASLEANTQDQMVSDVHMTDLAFTGIEQMPETAMIRIESKLADAPAFEKLGSFDTYLASISGSLEFRDTVDVDPSASNVLSPPDVSETQANGANFDELENSDNRDAVLESSAPVPAHFSAGAASEASNIVIIGGIKIQNPSLVIGTSDGRFADVPVDVKTLRCPATEEGLLLSPEPSAVCREHELTSNGALRSPSPILQVAKPILLLSAAPRSDIEVEGMQLDSTASIEKTATAELGVDAVRTLTLPAYTMVGDLTEDLFGVPGLRGKIYTFQNMDPDAPIREMVRPELGSLGAGTFGSLFPAVSNEIMKKLPIENVQLVYSEDQNDLFHSAGLRIEGDIKFTGGLQPVADVLDIVFGSGNNKAPSGLHIAAHLAEERDWRQMPAFSNIALQGSFENMSVWAGEWLKFTRIGVEVSSNQVIKPGTDQTTWSWGHALFGELDIYKIPGMGEVPLHVGYRIRKVADLYHMSMALTSDTWTGVFGIENLTIHGVRFDTAFSAKSFGQSLSMEISAFMSLGKTDIYLSGGYSKEETFLEAEVGNMTWADVVNCYHQIMGEPVSEDTQGNNITFESIYLRVSTKGVTLSGKVSFNDHTSAEGLISFDEYGLTIQGGVDNVPIEGTDIEILKAGFDVFVGSKSKGSKGRTNRFAIHGEVKFSGMKVKVHFHTSKQGMQPRRWFIYGAFDGNVKVSDFAEILAGSDLDNNLVLKNAAILATNMDKGIDDTVNPLKYPVSKGLSVCALLEPLETVNKLAGGKKVDGLMLAATIGTAGSLKFAIHLPASMTVDLGESAEFGNFGMAVEISKDPRFILNGDLTIKMKDQDPLVLELAIYAGPIEAGGYARTHTVWKNPFGLSDKVEIRELAVELAFNYATGPSKLGLGGDGSAGDISCTADIVVSQRPDQQLLHFDISKINVAEIIRFTGEVIDNQALREVGGGDFLVFRDAGMYFSTGATLAGKPYPPGISAHGKLEVFGKNARFDAAIGQEGILFDGAVDNFCIGPLKVQSASGGPQAILKIVMTTDEQLIHIDGLIEFLSLKLKMLVKASVQPLVLDADVEINLTDRLHFQMRALAENVDNYKDLSQANLKFAAELDGDVLAFICDGVITLLDHLQDTVTGGIDSMEFSLWQRKKELIEEKDRVQKRLSETEQAYTTSRKERQKDIEVEEAKRRRAREELEALEKALDEGKIALEEERTAARKKLDDAKLEREAAYRVKTAEYQEKLEKAREQQSFYERRREELRSEKTMTFGNTIRLLEEADRDYDLKKTALEPYRKAYVEADADFDRASFLEKPFLSFKLAGLRADYEIRKAVVNEALTLLHNLKALVDTPEYRQLESTIDEMTSSLTRAANSVDVLIIQGPDAFARELLRNEELEVETAKRELDALMDANSKYMKVISDAQAQLDARKPELLEIILKADEAIRAAEEDREVAALKAALDKIARLEEDVSRNVALVEAGLELVRKGITEGTKEAKDLLAGLKKSTIRITKVSVKIDARELARGEALTFVVVGELAGVEQTVTVQWSPVQATAELFEAIVKGAF